MAGLLMDWDLKSLREDVELVHGKSQLEFLVESCNSIVDRQNFAHFHYHEAMDIFNDHFKDKQSLTDAVVSALVRNHANAEEFSNVMLKVRAHILGFMQSLHSISDTLSHVIFYSFGCDKSTNIKPHRISIYSTLEEMRKQSECTKLVHLIECLIEHKDYEYLLAMVNHSKHRSIIQPMFSANLINPTGEHHEIKFKGFSFNGNPYAPRLAFKFMESEYDRQSQLVTNIGNEINTILHDHRLQKK